MKGFNYFLYVGNAYPHKNLERAIRAILLLRKKSGQDIQFFIVSSRNVFTGRLEKIVKKLGADDFVKLLGFISDKELQELYKKSLGFLYPSLSEGFGLPGLEAMKAGTVVLASDIPVFKEIYQDKVFYFDPKNIELIEKALRRVLEMKESERRGIINDAKKFVERYSWERMARQTLSLYGGILLIRG
jgi:glycosyltransferase involved in cell wall biosynthesis